MSASVLSVGRRRSRQKTEDIRQLDVAKLLAESCRALDPALRAAE
jgi:hypothetical protein